MARFKNHRRGRAIATAVVCLAVAGAAAVGIATRTPKSSPAIETTSIFKTATVSTGDLTTTERIDGIVQLSSTLPVVHRIEGQTSSASNSNSTSTPSTTPAEDESANPNALSSTLLADDCAPATVPTTMPETTTTMAPPDTTTAGTTPDTTPGPTTTVEPVASVTEPSPVVPPADATCDNTTTTAPDVATTTVPGDTIGNDVGGDPTANRRTGATGPSGASNSSTGSTESTARVTQTITSIIGVNTAVQQGDVLYTVDGSPVVALDGALPAWRSLSTASDDGADIAQLEASLAALGYDPDSKVTVDNQFDSATRSMVKAWQRGLGVEATGTVELGSVVFLPSSTTVSAVDQAVGNTVGDGDTVLTLAAPTQEVLVDVPEGDEAQVVPGLTVEIGSVQGAVSRLRSADRDGSVVVEAVITPATAIENATNGSSVNVTLTLQNDSGVLIVPAEALVSRLDGSYAVQVQESDGTKKWATVDLLGVSGVNVAIRGANVADGTVLLLPA